MIDVSADGRTHFARNFGRAKIAVEIAGHSLPIDRSRGHNHPGDVRCTGGRNPCMLVDSLMIRVNGHLVEVPRSIVTGLSDANRAGLAVMGPGTYKLVIEGGDAAEAYTAIVRFDHKRVKQRDIIDGEAGMLAERTVYRDLSHAFAN
jgi:hypothetical protein